MGHPHLEVLINWHTKVAKTSDHGPMATVRHTVAKPASEECNYPVGDSVHSPSVIGTGPGLRVVSYIHDGSLYTWAHYWETPKLN